MQDSPKENACEVTYAELVLRFEKAGFLLSHKGSQTEQWRRDDGAILVIVSKQRYSTEEVAQLNKDLRNQLQKAKGLGL